MSNPSDQSFAQDKYMFHSDHLLTFCSNFSILNIQDQTDTMLETKLTDLENRWEKLENSYENLMLSPVSSVSKELKEGAKLNFQACSEIFHTWKASIMDILKITRITLSSQNEYSRMSLPLQNFHSSDSTIAHQHHQIAPAANGSTQISTQQKSQIRNQLLKRSLITHPSIESNHALLNNMSNKPLGRPILKEPVSVQPIAPQSVHNPVGQSQSNIIQNSQPIQTVSQMQKYPELQQPRQIVCQQLSTHIIQHQILTSYQNNMLQHLYHQQQRPIVLQRHQIQQNDLGNSRLCHLYFTNLHMTLLHADCNQICGMVQTKLYISRLNPRMAPLLPDKYNLSVPFQTTGFDFAGIYELKTSTTRKAPYTKGFASDFRFSTRAIHLEVCSAQSSAAFREAVSRFIRRRGLPYRIVSDNVRNFLDTRRELQK